VTLLPTARTPTATTPENLGIDRDNESSNKELLPLMWQTTNEGLFNPSFPIPKTELDPGLPPLWQDSGSTSIMAPVFPLPNSDGVAITPFTPPVHEEGIVKYKALYIS
jgi:hypothetical protein